LAAKLLISINRHFFDCLQHAVASISAENALERSSGFFEVMENIKNKLEEYWNEELKDNSKY